MKRRTLLIAAGGVVGFGACTSALSDTSTDDGGTEAVTPSPEQTPTETQRPTETETQTASRTSEAQLEARFESVVEDRTPDHFQTEVEAFLGTTEFLVDIAAYVENETEMRQLVAVSIGAYAGLAGHDMLKERMDVDLYSKSGEYAGGYVAEADWAEAYYDEEIDTEEYMERVLETFEGP